MIKGILLMPSGNFRGGAEEALLQFARHAPRHEIEWEYVLLQPGDMEAELAATGVPVRVIDAGRLRQPGRFCGTVRRLAREIRDRNAAVVLSWMTKAHLYGGPAAALAGVPACYFQHGIPDGGVVDRLTRLIPAAGGLACSDYIARLQAKRVRHRVIGIPMAADTARFEAVRHRDPRELKVRLGFEASRPFVGIVGRLQRWKGHHVFVQAMAAVRERFPECQAVIVGGPHEEEAAYAASLQTLIGELGLGAVVRLVGAQRNVPEWIQAMDVVVHASDREPFGLVILEAMALGKPVIATRPGGPEEIITAARNGMLVPFGDTEALAGAITWCLSDPAAAEAMGRAALVRSRDFTPRRMAQGVHAAVLTLASPSPDPRTLSPS